MRKNFKADVKKLVDSFFVDSKIIEMYFFYKGYNVSVSVLAFECYLNLVEYYTKFEPEHQKYYKDYIEQLDAIVDDWNNSTTKTDAVFTANVFVLVNTGYLKNDDQNGMLYIYEK